MTPIKPIILGCAGTVLTADEKALFAEHNPAGFILFQRNCVSKSQTSDLVSSLRDAVGRVDAPVLIDQEGGSVARLKAPEWREYPSSGYFGKLSNLDLPRALRAVYLNAQLMACELQEMGITVNCNPILDVPSPECHGFLSDSRTFHDTAERVTNMGTAVCEGLLDGGVMPVIKHIPGHGRGTADSHKSLPHVDACLTDLKEVDFAPFAKVSAEKWGGDIWAMAAHVVYSALDPVLAASQSKSITHDIIRTEIGFDGLLLADDISMQALSGTLAERAIATLNADMDLTMHCNGVFDEMVQILEVLPVITDQAISRMDRAETLRQQKKQIINEDALLSEWTDLIKDKNAA